MSEKVEFYKLYEVDDDFIQDLRKNVDSHVFSNIDPNYNHTRKYLGVVLNINGCSYYAPLSSPKESDYIMLHGRRVIRNSILPIIRMVETDSYGKRHLLGTIKLSNMIPIPENKIVLYDLDNEQDQEYRNLVFKEKRFINRNEELILSYAEALYKEKTDGTSAKGYLTSTFDFRAFEAYVKAQYTTPEI